MNSKVYFSLMFILFCMTEIAQAELEPRIWGETGYVIKSDRISSGHELSLPDFISGKKVNETDRWLFTQSAYLELNARLSNRMFVGFDTTLLLSGKEVGSLSNTLKQIYIIVPVSDRCMLSFGKQRLKWGTAKVFNAIDKLEKVLDPLSDERFKEGVAGIKVVLIPSEWFSFSLVAMPETGLNSSRLASRFDFLVLDTDIGFGMIKYNFEHLTGSSFLTKEKLNCYAAFFDLIRYFGNLGLYLESEYRNLREMEYAFENTDNSSYKVNEYDTVNQPVFRMSTGVHCRIENTLKMDLLFEYFYNNEGFNDAEAKNFYNTYKYYTTSYPKGNHQLPANFVQFGSFRRHYLCLGLQNIEVANNLKLGISAIANLEPLFFDFKPEMEYIIDNNIFILVEYDLYHQYVDSEKSPSLFNFMDKNNSVKLTIKTNF
ncbi:MAG: hypothetical protein ABIJ30_12745 [bacterium]